MRGPHSGDRIYVLRRAIVRKELRKSLLLNIGSPVVVSDIQPKPGGVAKIVAARSRVRAVEVNPCIGKAIVEHGIAGAGITVTNDFTGAAQSERRGHIVQCPQQPGCCPNLCRREEPQIGWDIARQKRQYFTIAVIDTQ